jgi:hypothetical protein
VQAGEQRLRLCAADSGDRGLVIGGAVRDGREQLVDLVLPGWRVT